MNDNFDPGERVAATSGLRGAFDGSDAGGFGGVDTSWMNEGYGFEKSTNYSLDKLFNLFDKSGMTEAPNADAWSNLNNGSLNVPAELNYLPQQKFLDNWSFDGKGGRYWGMGDDKGQSADFRKTLQDLFGEGGLTVNQARNMDDPTQSQYNYSGSNGKELGNYISNSHDDGGVWGAVKEYGPGLAKMGLAAGISSALPGMGAGLLGSLGSAAATSAASSFMNGGNLSLNPGDIATKFAANAIPGIDPSLLGGAGEYSDLISKSLKGAALGGIRGGSQGALIGGASPLVQQGFNKVGDVLKNSLDSGGGNVWEQDSFGSGGYSSVPSTLDNVFSQNGIGGMQQGPMSTTPQMQSQGGGQLDWGSILSGEQGFGNTNPQGQESQPNAFGLGMDFGQGQNMPSFNLPAQTPSTGGIDDDFINKHRDLLGGLGDGVKAALIAKNPQYAALFGQQKMNPVGAGLGALASLYYNHNANGKLKDQAKSMNLGQDSSYMKALRQQTERRDAAGGRRSQYGPREVELQAKLAEMNQRNAPTQFAIAQQRNMNNARTLQDLLGFGKQSGAFDAIGSGLQGLFKG
jgi:hypothetical protein